MSWREQELPEINGSINVGNEIRGGPAYLSIKMNNVFCFLFLSDQPNSISRII
jgi:hypothetical protein